MERYRQSVTLDGTGSGTVTVTARSDFTVGKYIVLVRDPATLKPASGGCLCVVSHNGFVIDTTRAGHLATSDTVQEMATSDVLTCEWAGGLAGGLATFYVTGG